MRYPRNMQYLGYKIRDNYDTCTSKCSGKPRYRGIDTMYIRVKILYKYNWTPQGTLKQRFPAPSPNDRGERSVGKIQLDNMALRMNTMFLKVLQEVLSGFLITEPNVERRNRIKRRRPGTKRIPSWSGFTCFGCHSTVYLRERERERERTHHNQITKKRKERKRRMHEHVMCKI